MKTIGLIGGMSWESTLEYYRLVNEFAKDKLGGLHSAKCIIYSVDFGEIEPMMRTAEWGKIAHKLTEAAGILEAAGAQLILLCTNTMHKVYDEIQQGIKVSLLHIADTAADEVINENIETVGLLGTRQTMEQDFYRSRIADKGLKVLIPGEADREIIHKVIFNELCLGKITNDAKVEFIRIINKLASDGAQGIVLGCTEIPLLIKREDVSIPLFDTTLIHVRRAIEIASDI